MDTPKRGRGRPRIHPIKESYQKYTRINSVFDAINILCINGSDLKTIISHSNKLYIKHGGTKANSTALINITKNALDTLIAWGIVKLDNRIYKFNKGEEDANNI